MKHALYILSLLLLPLLIIACTGPENETSGTEQSPELIMFYTDN